MGVKGLSSFIEDNSQIYLDMCFRNNKLVVDGSNLCYHLYFSSNLDQNHGGEYAGFQDLVRRFFTALKDCAVEPYVVLDGGSDFTDKKLDTLMKRAGHRIRQAHVASLGSKEDIMPPLSKLVFKQTLAGMEVPLAQCFGEADCHIAALASEWGCPVLSKDSDFYVFDLPAGLMPLNHFQWGSVTEGRSGRYVPCKHYKTSSFCVFFDIRRQLLPAFASLAGNDYVKLGERVKEPPWAEFLPMGRRTRTRSAARLGGLLCWLRRFQTSEDALNAAITLVPTRSRHEKTELLNGLSLAMDEYRLHESYLRGYFNDGTPPPLPRELARLVPAWVAPPLTRVQLSGDILDVLLHKRVTLGIQVDHRDLQSANLTSRPVRQVMYGLLLCGHGGDGVLELDRNGLDLTPSMVQTVRKGAAQKLNVESLNEAAHTVRLQVFLKTLGVREATLSHVPAHLRLPVAVTCYWERKSSPTPEPKLLQALLLIMVHGEINRQKTVPTGSLGWQGYTNQISKHVDLNVAHSFNQWQASMKDSIYLNQLLCKPLPEPHIAWLYQGRLVHRWVNKLRDRKPEKLLPGAPYRQLYKILMDAVLQSAPQQPEPLTRRRDPPAFPKVQLALSMDRLLLNTQEEEDEQEKHAGPIGLAQGSELFSVKTRYRIKSRGERSRNPELDTSRRGWAAIDVF